jgi:hypothetical protein
MLKFFVETFINIRIKNDLNPLKKEWKNGLNSLSIPNLYLYIFETHLYLKQELKYKLG